MIGAQGAFDPRTGLLSSAPHIPGWLGFDVAAEAQRRARRRRPHRERRQPGRRRGDERRAGPGRRRLRHGVAGRRRRRRGRDRTAAAARRHRRGRRDRLDARAGPGHRGHRRRLARGRRPVRQPASTRRPSAVSPRAHGIQPDTAWDAVTKAAHGSHPFLDRPRPARRRRHRQPRRASPTRSSCSSAATPAAPAARTSPRWCRKSCTDWSCRARPSARASVQGNAVRAGALQSALATAREDVFGVVTPNASLRGRCRHRGRKHPSPTE